jgi:uncharacterized protein YqeY
MSLKDQIFADMKTCMREKDSSRLESIRMLRAAIQRQEVDSRTELDEEQVLAVIQKMLKQSQDAIRQFNDGERPDLAEKEQVLVDHLMAYMPEQMDETELESLINDAITASGAERMRDMGKVMGIVKGKVAGRADMGMVSGKIKALLS